MIDLRGKPIAITGASSGIGRATAIACAAAGMPVALAARRVEKLESAVAEIRASGGRAIAVPTDVDRPEDCRTLLRTTIEAFGPIYAVFANAGYGLERPIHLTTDAELRAIFETNFFGTMNTIRPALEQMLPARAGHILICSSCLAKTGTPMVGAYSATKAAQDHIARAMRAELRRSGVAISSVHPIGTATEFFDRKGIETGRPPMSSPPKFFLQTPERVARAIVRRLRRGRGAEVWTNTTLRLGFACFTAFPGLADWALARYIRGQNRRT
jgi:NAD(P)-dependent dehydrogenase (short-subunit alcohol dehydrogenase family)